MGSPSIIGLLFEIGADPSRAAEALKQFETATGKSFAKMPGLTDPLNKSLLSNRESVRLLSEEMGVHLPHAVAGAIAEMMPAIGGLGTGLLAAFAIEEIPKLIKGIHDASDEMAGFGKEAKKAFEAAVSESDKAVTHFRTIKEGIKLENEVNRNIAALSVQRDVLDSTGGVAVNWARAVFEFMSGNIAAGGTFVALAKAQQMDMAALGKLEEERTEQLNTRTQLEIKAHEDAAKAAHHSAEEQARLQKQLMDWLHKSLPIFGTGEPFLSYGHHIDGMTKSLDVDVKSLNLWVNSLEEAPIAFKEVDRYLVMMPEHTNHVSAALKEHAMMAQYATEFNEQFTDSITRQIEAVKGDWVGSTELLTAGLAGLIGGRKAQAGVEMVWEIGRGVACLAEGAWPPNPAAIIAAGLHFEAAAQYGILAGKSSGHRAGAGGGAGSYSSSRGDYGRGSESRAGLPPPDTLAPGAAGAGGRFSGTARVVVFGTDHELQNWVAGAVNGAVNRGVTVQATSAQRGSPVGH